MNTEMKSKKAQSVGALLPIGMTFVVLTIGLAIGLQVAGDVKDDIGDESGTTSEEYNASVKGIEGLAKFPKKLPIIATVLVAVVLIGLLVRNLMMRMG